jgi:hypothetical protein
MSIELSLLKGGCVLTLDPDIGNYRQGDAGQARKRRGQLLDVDLARVKRLAYESRDYVVAKSGFQMRSV